MGYYRELLDEFVNDTETAINLHEFATWLDRRVELAFRSTSTERLEFLWRLLERLRDQEEGPDDAR
jgi:hypothetical protein